MRSLLNLLLAWMLVARIQSQCSRSNAAGAAALSNFFGELLANKSSQSSNGSSSLQSSKLSQAICCNILAFLRHCQAAYIIHVSFKRMKAASKQKKGKQVSKRSKLKQSLQDIYPWLLLAEYER